MIHHHGGGIGDLQDVCSVDHEPEQNDMVQEESLAGAGEDGTRPGESDVTVESDSMSETDYDMGSGSERGDNGFF